MKQDKEMDILAEINGVCERLKEIAKSNQQISDKRYIVLSLEYDSECEFSFIEKYVCTITNKKSFLNFLSHWFRDEPAEIEDFNNEFNRLEKEIGRAITLEEKINVVREINEDNLLFIEEIIY